MILTESGDYKHTSGESETKPFSLRLVYGCRVVFDVFMVFGIRGGLVDQRRLLAGLVWLFIFGRKTVRRPMRGR